MKLFGLHVPGTRDTDAEIERLKQELRDGEIRIKVLENNTDRLLHEKWDVEIKLAGASQKSQEQDAFRVGQIQAEAARAEKLKEENREMRQEVEAHRTAFNALAVIQGLSPDLSQERMLGLARQAAEIERAANASCSLSYELFAVQVCDAADRILPALNPQEAKFFAACLGDNYTPVHERGQDWQSEHEIRQQLYREMYGDPEAYDDFEEEQEQEKARGGAGREEEPEQEQQQGMDLSIGV
jgi:hypothetical protein